MESKKSKSDSISEPGMVKVELHRAESISGVTVNITESQKNTTDVYAYTWAKASGFFEAIRGMKVEVVMFLYIFSYIIRSVSSTSMIMDKVCLVHLHYSEEVCSNLKLYENVKDEVDKMANNYHLGHSMVQLIPSAILSLFVGSWSDKYSRKIPIIAALVGIVLDGIGSMFCAYYMKSKVEYYYIPAIFTGLSGGSISVLTVLYSYSSDITSRNKRTFKYAVMEFAFGMAIPLGALLGGWLYKFYGYLTVFAVSTSGHFLGLLWVIFVLEETKGLDCKERWEEKFRKFWSCDAVVSSFRAVTKIRPNKGKEQIIGLIVAMSVIVFSFASTANIGFFYVHKRYDWDNTTYSTVYAVFSVAGLLIMMIIVPVCKWLKIDDPILGLVGSISLMLKFICIGIASIKGIYFLGNLLGLLSSLSNIAGRSRISKVTSKDDLGKVFSFLTTAESILPILATAVVSQIFNATIDSFPGLLYLVMGGLFIIPIVIFAWISRQPTGNYEEMEEEPDEAAEDDTTNPVES